MKKLQLFLIILGFLALSGCETIINRAKAGEHHAIDQHYHPEPDWPIEFRRMVESIGHNVEELELSHGHDMGWCMTQCGYTIADSCQKICVANLIAGHHPHCPSWCQ